MSTWDYVKAKVIYHWLLPLGVIAALTMLVLLYALLSDMASRLFRRWRKK